jgi:hypothetical protein
MVKKKKKKKKKKKTKKTQKKKKKKKKKKTKKKKKKTLVRKFISESLNVNNPLLEKCLNFLTSKFTTCFRERFGDTSVWIYEE